MSRSSALHRECPTQDESAEHRHHLNVSQVGEVQISGRRANMRFSLLAKRAEDENLSQDGTIEHDWSS